MAVPINNKCLLGLNDFGPKKMSSRQQMASDTFIFKFVSVSGFHRHNTEDQKLSVKATTDLDYFRNMQK